jgi:sugar phosphate isomerase/epimerase
MKTGMTTAFTRRSLLAAPLATPLLAAPTPRGMVLAIHQSTTAAAGYRRSLEGYAKAGIRHVEVTAPQLDEFAAKEGMAAARGLIKDLGMTVVASASIRGLLEPRPGRAKAIELLKARVEILKEFGADRIVAPSAAPSLDDKFTLDDYKRGADNAREAGEIARPFGITVMPEFQRGGTFYGTLPTALRLTREAAHPNVKPMLDFYHFRAGLSRMEDLDLIHEGELHHVHFQDVPDIPREMLDNSTREVPGKGISPLVRILQALKKKRYAGPLSVELFYPRLQQGDPYEVAMEIRKSAEPVLRQAGVV